MTDARPNIWRLQAQSDIDGLIQALENSDPDIRLRAAIALRALSATSAISALRARLTREDNAEARTNITQVLVFLLEEHEERGEQKKNASPPDETTLLINQLKSPNPEDIIHAAQALGALGDTLAVEPLIALFDNPKMPPNVRLAAAEALIELKSPPTSVTTLVALRRPAWHIRRIAAAMLGHLEADWAVEPLRKTLSDENELVRRTARAALHHIGTPEALKAADSVADEPPKPQAPVEQAPPTTTVEPEKPAPETKAEEAVTAPEPAPVALPATAASPLESPPTPTPAQDVPPVPAVATPVETAPTPAEAEAPRKEVAEVVAVPVVAENSPTTPQEKESTPVEKLETVSSPEPLNPPPAMPKVESDVSISTDASSEPTPQSTSSQ